MADWYVVYETNYGTIDRTLVEASNEDDAIKKAKTKVGSERIKRIIKVEPM
ncbi:MAG: hypothetical protein LBH16_07290 [Treponema sp.]|jgi:hypothetical protein|nr:hypothetical protein [Treponema sp.]